MASWEHFSHDADMGVRAVGATEGEVFEQMALGLTAPDRTARNLRASGGRTTR